ncbi:META domain-containing protein [Hoyosella rhizosphaerae]|uniref:META domain-containing protein n=1 Tax=Hoyosella rhizosphaerae TaxID=1755582 RepID=A0A916X8T0_9ACTN|nr:META domain-containing protein [Hoyosella rhizosphaerae]MBN4927258.1 META domain-containing protein [Hoyosella rhizosphaerae]GGC52711.1 META domain-containing protein [Hoyosella rhizosphaerae]
MDELSGRTFLSTGVDGVPIPGGGPLRIEFNEDGTLSANAGCNTVFGGVRFEHGRIITGELASTLIGCPPETAGADEWVNSMFVDEPEWTIDGNELVLRTGDRTVTLLDRVEAMPDRPLQGTEWVLRSIITSDSVMSSRAIDESEPLLLIDSDGQVSGSTGCNRMNGSASINGDEIRFSPLATTRMACIDDRDEVERAVLSVLSETNVRASIEADTLTLMTEAGNGLTYVARE